MNEILRSIYPDPIPEFDSSKIKFRRLRDYSHKQWSPVETSDCIVVWQDYEYMHLGHSHPFQHIDATDLTQLPCRPTDIVINSYKTDTDHLWPCDYVFNSWHLVNTCMANQNITVEDYPNRPYFASILLGQEKPHRRWFYNHLVQYNQLNDNLVNLFGVYTSDFINSSADVCDTFILDKVQSNPGWVNTTTSLPGTDLFASQHVSKHIEQNTWISIVAETLVTNHIFFPTEKTGKALISRKPFIVLSSQYFLRNLRDLGFQTFDPVIDESYDLVEDEHKRVRAAFDSYMELRNKDPQEVRQQLMAILEHNEKLMRDKQWLTRLARTKLDTLL